MNDLLKQKLEIVPEKPGCYIMKDRQGTIIYIGKAKILKNRVRSYFTSSHDVKTQRLVMEIVDFEYIVTSSDIEALILEMNLIKKHAPKYNIMLKDDKSYPYIKITNERHPRLIITRKVKKDSGKYFGPYPHAYAASETKRLLDRLYPLRKCSTMCNRECLYYHMDQCLAPGVYEVKPEQYKEITNEITRFLNGEYKQVKAELKEKMEAAAEKLEFERAKEYRDQITHIEAIMDKQKMMDLDFTSRDIFGYYIDKSWMCVQVFFVRQGKLIERDVSLFPIYGEMEEEFLTFLGQFYSQTENIKPKEIYIPNQVDEQLASQLVEIKVHKPQRGKKKELVELANQNAKIALEEKFALIEKDERRTIEAVENLGEMMGIYTPYRIETFDNSNIQGADPVSALVVFTNGKPDKREYRKYKIKTVTGPDDYESMREVVRRRYTRVLKDGLPLPDLILVDGGKGQIEAVREIVEDELGISVPIAGLAKDDKHNTSQLLFGEPLEEVPLARNSHEFYLLQRIQDEVHRFAISFHRQLRGKSAFQSSLDNVEGIGPVRKNKLLRHFGSLKKMKEATVEELIEAGLPQKVASDLYENLKQ